MTRYLTALTRRSLSTFADLVRIMLPVMIAVRVGEEFGLSQMLGLVLGPVMSLVGLPPEAGIVWATSLLVGLYGGIGAYLGLLPALDLTVGQHSVLCAMMLFAHAIPIEQAIVRRAGASFTITTLLRVGAALLYGALVAWICGLTQALSTPLELAWLTGELETPGWTSWALATARSLASVLGIIILLFVALDALDRIGATRWITRLLEPVLRAIGLDSRLAPITTIGLLLGLTYGGALVIQSTRDRRFSPRARFLALSCLSLSHALIEDTALMLALGADVWVVLVGRVAFTLAVVAVLARILDRLPEASFRRWRLAQEPH
ncbi:MAG: nucleoside recognition domain-containing protein [Alphaproteobacteria bacterium]|nr:nucleoside recognition domain-containing protein [Alphaproteobacteria bacterium]